VQWGIFAQTFAKWRKTESVIVALVKQSERRQGAEQPRQRRGISVSCCSELSARLGTIAQQVRYAQLSGDVHDRRYLVPAY